MHQVSYNELKELIDEKQKYVLIDVREKHELKHGVIPTSHHIPLHEFLNSLSLAQDEFKKRYGFPLTKKDKLILYCHSGNRSGFAAKIAREKGFKASNFEGSILEWSKYDPNVKAY